MIEWDEEALACLRSAVHRGDGAAGLDVLSGRPLDPVLQYAGDVALMAVAQGRAEGVRLADDCRARLTRRELPGDAELAAELAAPLGRGPYTGLSPLPVDLGAVAAAMGGGPHVIDLRCGDVLLAGEADAETQAGDPSGDGAARWLVIPPSALPAGEDARRGAARRWLAGEGYRPIPRSL